MKKITLLIASLTFFLVSGVHAQITTYPYSEDFEAGDGGWTADNTTNGSWELGTPAGGTINSAASGANSWMTGLTGNYNTNEDSSVTSPVFDLSSLVSPSIEFSIWWNSEFSWDGMVLQSSIDNGASWQNVGASGDPNNWFTDDTINGDPGGQQEGWTGRGAANGSQGWVTARHPLTGLGGQSNVIFRFAFGSDGSVQDDGIAFDDISVFEVTCPDPGGLAVANVTTDSADISWPAGGAETEWEIVIQTAGTGVPTGAGITTTANNPYAATMLASGTIHEVYVRANCGADGFSSWVGPVTFTTLNLPPPVPVGVTCSSGTSSIVFEEDFEVDPPEGWTGTGFSGTNGNWDITTGNANSTGTGPAASFSGGMHLEYEASGSSTTIASTISPAIDLTPGIDGAELSFYLHAFGPDIGTLNVNVGNSPTGPFTTIYTWNSDLQQADTDAWVPAGINLDAYLGQVIYLEFSYGGAGTGFEGDLSIDLVRVESCGVFCLPPTNLEVSNVTSTSADIAWVDNNGQTEWEYVVQPAGTGVPTGAGTSVMTTSASLTTLMPETDYEVYVRTICGPGSESTWVAVNFTTNIEVDCTAAPVNTTYCYVSNDNTSFTFSSSDGMSPLAVVFNAGQVENNFDNLVVTDSDGTVIYDDDNGGDLAGLTFESTGPTITIAIDSDGSVDCQGSGFTPWDFNVSCVDLSMPPSCTSLITPTNGDTDIEIIGGNITWAASTNAPDGYFLSVGTTPGGTDVLPSTDVGNVTTFALGDLLYSTTYYVTIVPYNANGSATGCAEESFTTRDNPDQMTTVDCTAGPVNTVYCYENEDDRTFTFTSSDGTSPLAVVFNAGEVENNFDTLVVTDFDGTVIYNDDNGGDLTGLAFESTGPTITIAVDADNIVDCQGGGFTPWDFDVTCVDLTAPPSCTSLAAPVNGAVDVEIVGATITWNAATGAPDGYVVNVGTTPGGTDVVNGEDAGNVTTYAIPNLQYDTVYYVTIVPYNANGSATGCIEESFTTRMDPNQVINIVCADGLTTVNYCYANNDDTTFLLTSDTGFPVRLAFNFGTIDNFGDTITIYDGADPATSPILFEGDNDGDLTGLTVESTQANILIVIDSDGFGSCQAGTETVWEWTVECLTCFTPRATFDIVEDCQEGDQFLVDVDVTSIGDATSITIVDDFGSASQVGTTTGIYTFGPYPNGTPVVYTIFHNDDNSCVFTSSPQTQEFCPDQACNIVNAGYDQLQDCDTTSTDLSATFMISSITSNTSTYTISDLDCPPENLTGDATGIDEDDTWSDVIDLGFDFEFFGETYSQVVVGGNGLLSFDTSLATLDCDWAFSESLPDPALVETGFGDPDPLHRAAIFGIYHDIDPNVGGQIEFSVLGVAPERQFKVTFFEMPLFSGACNDLLTTHQIILYESSNVIDILVLNKPTCTTWNGGNAVIGIQNEPGTIGYAPPGRNTNDSPWDVTEQELWRFVPDGNPNYTFEWLDEDGNVISNNTDITVTPTETTTYTAAVTYALPDGSLVTITDDVVVEVQTNPDVESVEDFEECDDDYDGVITFDLTEQNANITSLTSGVTITYYDNLADAEAGMNMFADPTTYVADAGIGSVTLYFRIEDDVTGCYSTGEFEVNALLQINPDNITLEGECVEGEFVITVSPLNNGYDPATVTYEWSGGSSTDNNGDQFIATDDGEYTVMITPVNGCTSMQTFTVINSMCSFPQGISPNGDNLNDTWDLRAFKVRELEIFNSHGRSVYKQNNYTNQWRGQTNDNDELPVGTYFYVLTRENGEAVNGWVYLNK